MFGIEVVAQHDADATPAVRTTYLMGDCILAAPAPHTIAECAGIKESQRSSLPAWNLRTALD